MSTGIWGCHNRNTEANRTQNSISNIIESCNRILELNFACQLFLEMCKWIWQLQEIFEGACHTQWFVVKSLYLNIFKRPLFFRDIMYQTFKGKIAGLTTKSPKYLNRQSFWRISDIFWQIFKVNINHISTRILFIACIFVTCTNISSSSAVLHTPLNVLLRKKRTSLFFWKKKCEWTTKLHWNSLNDTNHTKCCRQFKIHCNHNPTSVV